MASWLFTSIQSMSNKVLGAIRGTPPDPRDAASPVADQNESDLVADLQKLSRMLARILAVQQDAEEREIQDRSVRLWLEELRGVAYEAEDVLDEYHYELLRAIVESGDTAIQMYHHAGERGIKRKIDQVDTPSSVASSSSTITKISIPDGMGEKIKSITERFEEISDARRDLHLREDDGTRLVTGPQIRQPTSSHVDKRAIFGREEEKEKIVSLLNTSSGPDFMVLPIVGAPGSGKTTLAQLVYNDSRVHQLFDKKCWVSVSEDFDLARLTKAINESMSNSPCDFSELSKIQDVLKEKISGISLFLVLDDVWNEKREVWDHFRVGFHGAKTVRILTTTRNTLVAEVMQTTSPFYLHFLPKENCWSLFKHFAFGNRDERKDANLLEIGHGIVDKCKGSPLAIKALGGILRYEADVEKWREILENNISEIDETGEIMPELWLSYRKLRLHLRPCFLYLSMFPKGTLFEKAMVVRLWMAQGYINGNTRNLKTLEEIGSEYFDELHGRSLIDHRFGQYLLHDLIHDLASSISQGAYQPGLENDQQWNNTCKMHHLYITKHDEVSNFLAPRYHRAIRTIANLHGTSNLFEYGILSKIACVRALHSMYYVSLDTLGTLKHLRYIHVTHDETLRLPESLCLLYNLQTLDLRCHNLQELPESIKNLVNLRYLQLESAKIEQLPKSIFRLQMLHTLSFRYCENLKELPNGIEQLTRLHILNLPAFLINMPCGIGKLTTLKPLSGHFNVKVHGMTGGLEELMDMNKLSGLLCISGLKNIGDADYSRKADLASKPNLNKLFLDFDEDHYVGSYCWETYQCGLAGSSFRDHLDELHLSVSSSNVAKGENVDKKQEDVLESLQPCGTITELKILHYRGKRFPSWLINSLLPKLTAVTIDCCSEPNSLPPFGQLAYLRFLKISGGTGVQSVGDESSTYFFLTNGSSEQPTYLLLENGGTGVSFPSLEVLSLTNMLYLEWKTRQGVFPCLKQLTLKKCPKIGKIATIPQAVRELVINDCGCHEIQFSLKSKIQDILISNCEELFSVHSMDGDLPILEKISVWHCPKLHKFSGIRELPILESISLNDCPVLRMFPTIPENVKRLTIYQCGFRGIMLRSRSDNLTISNCQELILINWSNGGLNSTADVTLEYCPKLKLLTIPSGIKKLMIHECGLHKIMFPSMFEILTISNCRELISINWSNGGLNSISEITFENCPELIILTIPSGLKKLKINECGFLKIMLPSRSENITISNCKELISINWSNGGLNSTDEVSFEYCPKLVLPTIPSGIKKLKIHECGFRGITFPSISENLTISNCLELISVNWRNEHLISIDEVSLECCPQLVPLTIPSGIKKLKIHKCGFREITLPSISEKLTISNCLELISVNWRDEHLISTDEVSFECCPNLVLPTIPSGIKKLKIYECGFRGITFPSISENLTISNCLELNSVNWRNEHLISIEEVSFEGCPKLVLLIIPSGIKKLKIHKCGFRKITFPSISEKLTISNCLELISVNWRDEHLISIDEVSFECCPNLVLPTIPSGIKKLRIQECGFRGITFPSISENLTISNCLELNSVNWRNEHLVSIEEVSFEGCPKLVFLIIPSGIKKLKIHKCGFRKITFPSISERLTISNCSELISVNWRDKHLISTDEVSFECCPKLVLPTIPSEIKKLKIHECSFREITFPSISEKLTISNCLELTSVTWRDKHLNSMDEITIKCCPKLGFLTILSGIKKLKISYCGIQEIVFPFQSSVQMVDVSHCPALTSLHWAKRDTSFHTELLSNDCPELKDGLETLRISYCSILQFPTKSVLQSITKRAEIYDCPRMDLGKRYVYQKDTVVKEVNTESLDLVPLTRPLLFDPSCQWTMLNLSSLVTLEISSCSKVRSVIGLDNLSKLIFLSISGCPELCNWKDRRLPVALKFLELECCDKLQSVPLLSVENQASPLKVLVIIDCPMLSVLEGFNGLMNLRTVELRRCRNISILPAIESLNVRPHITISDCPLLRDWCQRNSITY